MRWSDVLFGIAIFIILFRWWLIGPAKSDGAGVIAGCFMLMALLIAAAGALARVAGH